ncbi:MAG TPA: biopolymer transporter ExbD [Stenomitos sp.]
MKTYLEPDDLDVRIEIVPLIDVIFCILVFFILGAMNIARLQGLNLDLPQAETAKTQLSDTLPVQIDALGQTKVENTVVTDDQLTQILTAYVQQKPQGIVVIQADKLVSYGQVARLIDTLQKVGGSRVALGASTQIPLPQNGTLPNGVNTNPGLPSLNSQPGTTQSNPDVTNLGQPTLTEPGGQVPLDPTLPNPSELNPNPQSLTQPSTTATASPQSVPGAPPAQP